MNIGPFNFNCTSGTGSVLAWPFRSLQALPPRCLRAESGADAGLQPLWSRPPPSSAPQLWGSGQLLRGAGSTRQTLSIGDKRSTDHEGQLNSPSPVRHGLSLWLKRLCTPGGSSASAPSLWAGLALGPPRFAVRAGARGCAIVFAAVLPLDFEQARGWWNRFPPCAPLGIASIPGGGSSR